MREWWLVRNGQLLAGQDLLWQFEQTHGHARHQWIVDELELGRSPASAIHLENVWIGGAGRMIGYYDEVTRVDRWLESPEGRAALDEGYGQIRRARHGDP